MFRFLANTLDRILCVLCGIVFAQFPQFLQHYMQNLSGRVAELRKMVDSMQYSANLTGKNLDAYIAKFLQSSDTDFSQQGHVMAQVLGRYEHLSTAYNHLEVSQGLAQPFTFFYYVDSELVKSTFANFSLGVPLTLESGVYALCGIIFCYMILTGLRSLLSNFFSSRMSSTAIGHGLGRNHGLK